MTYFDITYKPVRYEANEDKGLDPFCHECTSHKARRRGYILMNRQGFRQMHRYIYWLTYGEQPDVVEHLCGNRVCINPAHLIGMTLAEAKRRSLPAGKDRPPKHYCHTHSRRCLSPEQLAEARRLLAEGGSLAGVAHEMGLDRRTIASLAAGETYREVQDG